MWRAFMSVATQTGLDKMMALSAGGTRSQNSILASITPAYFALYLFIRFYLWPHIVHVHLFEDVGRSAHLYRRHRDLCSHRDVFFLRVQEARRNSD